MTRFAFVTWDGGGNLPPAIGIARELQLRGHVVRFLGYSAQRAGIEGHGFAFSSLVRRAETEDAMLEMVAALLGEETKR